ncbi:MAG TPA: VOC family protein [Chloroflexota bacterium]|nr:VOC family protein [Chloroflexota bacterium]
MNTTPRFGFAIEYVDDIDAATRFYTDILGLRVERSAPTFVQFEHFALAGDEPLSGKRELELYWLVDDAEAAFSEMSRTGTVSLPLKQMPFGKVFGIQDPDGQSRFVLELAANRPSQAPAAAAGGRVA